MCLKFEQRHKQRTALKQKGNHMTNRVTMKQLEAACRTINRLTDSPEDAYTRCDDGTIKANIGHYHIGQQYAGVSLDRMASDGGGIMVIFHTTSKRELLLQMQAYMTGYRDCMENSKKV